MIERAVPKDILKHQSKIFAGLTARQVVYIGIACGVGLGLFSFTSFIPSIKIRVIIAGVPAAIFIAFGFLTIMGQPLEKIGVDIFVDTFLTPPVRKKEIHYPEMEKYKKAQETIGEDGKRRKLKVDKEGNVVVKRSQSIKTIR